MERPTLTLITPAFNEQESLPNFFAAVIPVLESTGESFEVIVVNDGSRDKTAEIIREFCAKDKRIKAIDLSRNFGQMAAIYCGMEHASGQAVIVMDADLQDSPETITDMLAKWKEGFDVVHARRTVRKGETFFKKFTSLMFIKTTNRLAGLDMPEDSGEFKLYDRKVVDALLDMPERSKYLRAQIAWVGFKQADVFFERKERAAGVTKYNAKKMFSLAETAIIPNSYVPFKITSIIGLSGAFLSFAAYIAFVILTIVGKPLPLAAWLLPTITLCTSVVLIANAVTNKYIRYIYDDVKNRPVYIEREKINFQDQSTYDDNL
ncbi:MAG: glycosyltransferase family 2 protein [Clostridia bacterium]|nr:glycosyltransferase family 2 protein [Clostridia bacterium]